MHKITYLDLHRGTTAYETQRNFIAGLRDKYTKCVRKSNTLVSDYNTIFINTNI